MTLVLQRNALFRCTFMFIPILWAAIYGSQYLTYEARVSFLFQIGACGENDSIHHATSRATAQAKQKEVVWNRKEEKGQMWFPLRLTECPWLLSL